MPMRRRSFVSSVGAAALAGVVPVRAASAATGANDAKLRALLDQIFADRLAENPEGATALGLDTGKNAGLKSQLSGRSPADSARDLARSKRELAAIRAIDPAALGEDARLDQDVVSYQLERSIAGRERFAYGETGGRFVVMLPLVAADGSNIAQ